MRLITVGGVFGFAGGDSGFWSSRAEENDKAYNSTFSKTNVIPSNGPNQRWHGLPLRCLSTVLDI